MLLEFLLGFFNVKPLAAPWTIIACVTMLLLIVPEMVVRMDKLFFAFAALEDAAHVLCLEVPLVSLPAYEATTERAFLLSLAIYIGS